MSPGRPTASKEGRISPQPFTTSVGGTTRNGTKVKVLPAGNYLFVVSDKSSLHNFTLNQVSGGKVVKILTGTSFTGVKKVTVTLRTGKWEYLCSVHPTIMFGFFTVK